MVDFDPGRRSPSFPYDVENFIGVASMRGGPLACEVQPGNLVRANSVSAVRDQEYLDSIRKLREGPRRDTPSPKV